jgi:hypothetical protein
MGWLATRCSSAQGWRRWWRRLGILRPRAALCTGLPNASSVRRLSTRYNQEGGGNGLRRAELTGDETCAAGAWRPHHAGRRCHGALLGRRGPSRGQPDERAATSRRHTAAVRVGRRAELWPGLAGPPTDEHHFARREERPSARRREAVPDLTVTLPMTLPCVEKNAKDTAPTSAPYLAVPPQGSRRAPGLPR